MAFRLFEKPASRDTSANPPSETRIYQALGSNDSQFVKSFAYGATPAVLANVEGILYRQDIQVKSQGDRAFLVEVPYTARKRESGSWSFNFDTTGGSFHIKASKETIARYGAGAPDCKQLIGVNTQKDDVAGADIVIPALKITVEFRHPLGVITIPYAKHLSRLTGKVNSDTFLTFAPGEVLFLGATGADGSDSEAAVSYHFACSENLQNQVIGAITGINKKGHEVLWIQWKDADDGGFPVKQPEFIYVERVYDTTALASALGFGG